MDCLPEEVILHILSFLAVPDIVHLQSVSRRYLTLGRDSTLWKTECFEHSRSEALRRRQKLRALQPAHLAELRNALTALPGSDLSAWDVANLRGTSERGSEDAKAEARLQRTRALANWEPGYPDERLDYYEEFIHRHAPIDIGWLELPKAEREGKEAWREATGLDTLKGDAGNVAKVVAPLDDGSICLWDVSERSTSQRGGGGKLLHHTRAGVLTRQPPEKKFESHTMMTETGAVEVVSVDSAAKKGYFGVQNMLHEVDLETMQIAFSKQYPGLITALSEADGKTPLTVGTNWTIHLHDLRDPALGAGELETSGELIGGSVYSHATLSQPGPVSILHDSGLGQYDSSIWVAGRFTSLLNYDRRFFPRLRGTIHSGARIASLTYLPYPLVPQSLDLVRNPEASMTALTEARSAKGTTIIAAAEYKGKGSLELYGLPRVQPYQNRQTASASKLLSVAAHGGSIVFSDGDGNLKWVERDGFSHVRTYNINDAAAAEAATTASGTGGDASAYGIWSSTASEMPGNGDIVQKIVPTHPVAASSTSQSSPSSAGTGRPDINTSDLVLWTGDGRIGMLGFGHRNPLGEDEGEEVEVKAQDAAERAKEDAERQYGMAMRRALERNADEVRFVRGLGMGYSRG